MPPFSFSLSIYLLSSNDGTYYSVDIFLMYTQFIRAQRPEYDDIMHVTMIASSRSSSYLS
jgi:hypothetical protein